MDDLEDTLRWEAAIGKMIFSFASLELVMLRLYEIKMPKRDYFTDDFECRFNKVIGLLKTDGLDNSIVSAFIEAKKLSEIRHLVAHSTLYFDVFLDDEAERIYVEQAIRDSRDSENYISLPALEESAAKAAAISTEIHNHFSGELWRDEG